MTATAVSNDARQFVPLPEPKVALVTTTIQVPTALPLFRECDDRVRFFVAGDENTPAAAGAYIDTLENARYIPPSEQTKWACSGYIPFRTIQRRNIATLEALQWGADILIFWDTDNLTLDTGYFDHFVSKFAYPFDGLCVTGFNQWFDPGQLLQPPVKHRGFPFAVASHWGVKPVVGASIGVCAGMCFGDPDIESVTRMATAPVVHGCTELARAGIVIDPHTRTVFNSQNTAFTRELAPALFLPPAVGRYDDIIASLVCQRVMQARELRVHIGQPFVHQDRNPHSLVRDLKEEIFGIEHIANFADWLDSKPLIEGTIAEQARDLYSDMKVIAWMPERVTEAANAWFNDVEAVLS